VVVPAVNSYPGEEVGTEWVLELATQPAAFRDRSVFIFTEEIDVVALFNRSIELLEDYMLPVVELEDNEGDQLEAWFHGGVGESGTVVSSITVLRKERIVDLYAASTMAGVVPGILLHMRNELSKACRGRLVEALDPEQRVAVPRTGVLLYESWGTFFEE
jgi:hypothetical protein